jgi:hypothetical protein
MANWRKLALPAWAAVALLLAGCATAAGTTLGTNPAAAPSSARVAALAGLVPEQWRLVRASGNLREITFAVPTCRRIARIAVSESSTRAVITVYADAGPACSWQYTGLHTVSLAQPISCERLIFDGATKRPPEFAAHADIASVTFACPAHLPTA